MNAAKGVDGETCGLWQNPRNGLVAGRLQSYRSQQEGNWVPVSSAFAIKGAARLCNKAC